ncbi:MAG: DUF4160 domain-containing protein [Verrucomicrobia bacterium]|nr:DUF4160 domain-containing protein [Verrucomicrobiota bacterium]
MLWERGYRFSFYSYDLGEPIHVHVTKAGCEAKFWLQPTRLAWNRRFREHELVEIVEILSANESLIVEKWNERPGH